MSNNYNPMDDSIFDWLKRIPDIPQDKRGIPYTSTCVCGGTITAIRSIENGHLSARCDICERIMIE